MTTRRTSRSTLLLLPLAWLVVVVVVAGLTWQVIDSAGRDVLTSGEPPLPAVGTTPDAAGGSTNGKPTATPGDKADKPRSERPEKSPPPTPRPTSQPTTQPSQPTQPAGPPAQPSSSARPEQSPSRAPSQQTQVRSWQGAAGTVTAACRGPAVSLESATPHDGWTVEVDDRGPERVKVKFTSGGDEERETEVEAECSGGLPRFAVESDDD